MAKKTFCILMVAVLLLTAQSFIFARSDACYMGNKDGGEYIEGMKFVFFGASCLFGPFGALYGFLATPQPASDRLAGKSSAYVADYTSCYKEKVMETQGAATLYGCIAFMIWAPGLAFGLFAWNMWQDFM